MLLEKVLTRQRLRWVDKRRFVGAIMFAMGCRVAAGVAWEIGAAGLTARLRFESFLRQIGRAQAATGRGRERRWRPCGCGRATSCTSSRGVARRVVSWWGSVLGRGGARSCRACSARVPVRGVASGGVAPARDVLAHEVVARLVAVVGLS